MLPAILIAISDESTSWYEPSMSVALMSITGNPATTPPASASTTPCSMARQNSRGTAPPTIFDSHSNPAPRSSGSSVRTAWPYWPLPPVWRTKRPSAFGTGRRIASR